MKCKCINCSKVYDDQLILENGELTEIACPCCGKIDKIKPYVEEINEQGSAVSPRKILHG